MFERELIRQQFLVLQQLLADGADVAEKIESMKHQAGLHGYHFVEDEDGWKLLLMNYTEKSALKRSLLRNGDMVSVKTAPFLSEVLYGPVSLYQDEQGGKQKVLVPSRYRGEAVTIAVSPANIRAIYRDGKAVVQFFD